MHCEGMLCDRIQFTLYSQTDIGSQCQQVPSVGILIQSLKALSSVMVSYLYHSGIGVYCLSGL